MSNNLAAAMNALKKPKTTPNININLQQPPSITGIPTQQPWQRVCQTRTNNINEIISKIKEIRKNQKLSQREMAKKANMSQTTISRIENNRGFSLNSITDMINALGKKLTIT